MKFFLTLIFAFSFFASAQECPGYDADKVELTALIKQFKKDCRRYPAQLSDLMAQPKSCKKWGGKTKEPYMQDKPETRQMIDRFQYASKGKTFTLKTMVCPE